MSVFFVGTTAVAMGGEIYGAQQQKKAAGKAADAQIQSAQLSVDESRRQFDEIKQLMAPYVEGGEKSMQLQQEFLGLSGPEAEQAAIDSVANGSQFKEMTRQGENAILQNASATGGLRGGNTQAVLAQYRPQVLNDLINQRYSQLAGMTSLGQNAAAMQGNAGINTAQNIGDQYTQMGAARAGEAIARGNANQQMAGSFSNLAGMFLGSKF
jgi:hypothetical protein